MRLLFADSWYFIALIHRRDNDHRAAAALRAGLTRAHLVTHDAVFTEVLTFFAESGPYVRDAAAQYVRRALGDPSLTVFALDRALFLAGLSLYEHRRDKEYSLVDCVSMHVMRVQGIRDVLTNDRHFSQEGFKVLSGAP